MAIASCINIKCMRIIKVVVFLYIFNIGCIEMLLSQVKTPEFLTNGQIDTLKFACNEFDLSTKSYYSQFVFSPFKLDSINYFKVELLDPTIIYTGQFDLIRKNNDTVFLRPGELFSKTYFNLYDETIFYSFADSLSQRRKIQTTVFNNTYVTLTNKVNNDLLNDTLILLKLKSSIDFTGIPFIYELVVSQKYGIVYYGLYNNMRCTCRRVFNDLEIDPYFLESLSLLINTE